MGWLIGDRFSCSIALKRLNAFSVTDLAVAPNGDVIVLERRFWLAEGVWMRIRRIPAVDVRPGATPEGDVLFEAVNRLNIDNMEAISIHRGTLGETVLTVMSDDNFNRFLQRTIILQFVLPAGAESRARR